MISEVKLQVRFSKGRNGTLYPIYQLQLPKALAEATKWKKGDVIQVSLHNRVGILSLSLKKKRLKYGGKKT